jgi:hypothetical protein
MAQKPASSKSRSRTTAKVVNNRSKNNTLAIFRSKWGILSVALVFMAIGTGTLSWVRAATTTHSVWSTNTVPKTITDSDRQAVELGMKFRAKYSGEVSGMRFYKGPQNTGTHHGNLWSTDGRKLATVKFTNETASGWQTANFAKPVPVSADTTYIISYFAPKGRYSVNENYFKAAKANGPLTALKSGAEGGNGVYVYSSKSAFPRQSYASSNYWVDVVYKTNRFNPTVKPKAPTDLKATVSGNSVTLNWTLSVSTGVARYEVLRDGASVKSDVTGGSWTDAGLATDKTYSYQVRAYDSTGQASDLSNAVSAKIPKPTTPTTPTPPTTPPTTPNPPAPGQSSACPLPKYPNAGCTGVPAGVSLKTISGTVVIDEGYVQANGGRDSKGMFTLYQKKVTGGVDIRTNDVVIQQSEINGPVVNDNTSARSKFTIVDSTVIGSTSGCSSFGNGAIGVSNYTATRVRVSGFPDAFRVAGSNILIEDSYATLCSANPNDHSDGLQAYGAANGTNITIRHNTIDQRAVTNGAATAPLFIPNDGDRQGNTNITVNVTDNLLAGGGYSMRIYGDLPFSAPNVTGNKIVNNTWAYGPVDMTCSRIGNWSGNAVVTYDFATGTVLSQVRALDDCN